MKHAFLLDENVLHHAVKGVNERDEPDSTAIELVLLIARNCHTITANSELWGRYQRQLAKLFHVRPRALEPVFFLRELLHNSQKVRHEVSDPPELPPAVQIPTEDIAVVRAALISCPKVVTSDYELREAINGQSVLQLQALTPMEALPLASEQ